MKKIFIILTCVFLAGCATEPQFIFSGATDLQDFDIGNEKIYVFPVKDSITNRNAKIDIENSLYDNGLQVVKDAKDSSVGLFFTFEKDVFSWQEQRPIWGKTGISSISTHADTVGSSYGHINGNTLFSGNNAYSNYSYNGNSNSSTDVLTKVNYSYGVTGYRQETVSREYVKLDFVVLNKDKMLGSYRILAFDATPNYILAYLPHLLPIVLGCNTEGNIVGINCDVKRADNQEYLDCYPVGI